MKWPTLVAALLLPLMLFGAAGGSAGDATVRFALTEADVQEVVLLKERGAWIKLTPGAAAELQDLTGENRGRQMVITLDTLPALQSRIFAAVDSGVLRIRSPSPELRLRLGEIAALRALEDKSEAGPDAHR